jgi:glycosyltransferase involved in cell wall biosynthesis
MVKGVVSAFGLRRRNGRMVFYSSSDFIPDSIPAWVLKLKFRDSVWVAGFYLFAANPFGQGSPYKGLQRLKGVVYSLYQLPVYLLIRKFADMVWVTSEPDRFRFASKGGLSLQEIVAVRGGVDTKAPNLIPEPVRKKFDAVFIGRFHPQKGILELVDIWRFVCEKRKSAMLAVIGTGNLEKELKKKIRDYELENNIVLFGFKDGVTKLKIFKDSQIVVHPATYDSGGMAACEAMACGLPGVSFDLPALKTYYPKGMVKTPCFDLKTFAGNILKLLNDKKFYERTAKDALDWAKEWDWDKRANDLLNVIQKSFTCRKPYVSS